MHCKNCEYVKKEKRFFSDCSCKDCKNDEQYSSSEEPCMSCNESNCSFEPKQLEVKNG